MTPEERFLNDAYILRDSLLSLRAVSTTEFQRRWIKQNTGRNHPDELRQQLVDRQRSWIEDNIEPVSTRLLAFLDRVPDRPSTTATQRDALRLVVAELLQPLKDARAIVRMRGGDPCWRKENPLLPLSPMDDAVGTKMIVLAESIVGAHKRSALIPLADWAASHGLGRASERRVREAAPHIEGAKKVRKGNSEVWMVPPEAKCPEKLLRRPRKKCRANSPDVPVPDYRCSVCGDPGDKECELNSPCREHPCKGRYSADHTRGNAISPQRADLRRNRPA